MHKNTIVITLCVSLLVGCESPDHNPPLVSITSPAFGATVGSQTPIQISATDASGISKVRVYARAQGSTLKGVQIGMASQNPYVISWNTTNIPNLSDAEIYAEAVDFTGETGTSDPVPVKTSNANTPALNYLAAFTIPKKTPVQKQGILPDATASLALEKLKPDQITAPLHPPTQTIQAFTKQATDPSTNTYFLEWNWNVFPGSTEYQLYASTEDAVGTYHAAGQMASNPSTTSGKLKTSRVRTDVKADQKYYGMVTALTAVGRSGQSNAFASQFVLDRPSNVSPQQDEKLNLGRPALSWQGIQQADGYLYFVYNRDPLSNDPELKEVWSSKTQSISDTSVSYPADLPDLPKGTYHWWVAGVKFNAAGKAYAFSYSSPTSFTVQ